MEELYPQIQKQNLISESYQNYQIAKNYYRQRRNNFQQLLEKNYMQAISIENEINQNIERLWNKEVFNIMQNIYWNKSIDNEQKIKQVQEKFNTSSPEVLNKLIYAIHQGNPRTFYSGLGLAFENFLSDNIIKPVLQKHQNIIKNHTNNLLNTFVSGDRQSKSSVVSGVKNIRSDILITYNIDLKDDFGVLKTSTDLPLELQNTLTIDWSQSVPNAQEIMSTSSLLEQFLDPSLGSFYGFSAKSWKNNSNSKEFMKSSIIQNLLNKVFNQTDSTGKRHSWQPDYTMEYVVYFLSHRIFDIISPTTVSMITRAGITWMDDFLSKHTFYMQVQMDNYWKKRNGGLGRIYPQIYNSAIYVRNYELMKDSIISYKLHKTKQGRYIDLKLT